MLMWKFFVSAKYRHTNGRNEHQYSVNDSIKEKKKCKKKTKYYKPCMAEYRYSLRCLVRDSHLC